jgi:hypothetical protein
MRVPRHRMRVGDAAILWTLVFLIGLAGGELLRQQAIGDPTLMETRDPNEPTIEALAAPPSRERVDPSPPATALRPEMVPDQTSTTIAATPSTAPSPDRATVVAPDREDASPTTVEPSESATTTTSTTSSSTTTTTTSPPQTTTTTIGCDPSPCPSQSPEEALR